RFSRDWSQTCALPILTEVVLPTIEDAIDRDGFGATIGADVDKLHLRYPELSEGTGYIAPIVTLEFGGRATGEPHSVVQVKCDIAEYLPELEFPMASPKVMTIERTFWEKATAAHVYCAQGRLRAARFARHWHDLAAIGR